MEHRIVGEFAQYLRLTLTRGEACWAGRGAIMSHDRGVHWELRAPGGVSGAARRMLSGEGIALTHLQSDRDGSSVSLASSQPGTISIWDLADGPVLTTRGAFLAALGDLDRRRLEPGDALSVSTGHLAAFGDAVDYDIAYVGGLGKALFSGEGLFMTTLRGPGTVLLQTIKRGTQATMRR